MFMSAAEYRDSLRAYRPRVFVNGRQVESVADEPLRHRIPPERYGLKLLVKTLDEWRRWCWVSKEFLTLEGMLANPLKYLTQLSDGVAPEQMVRRLVRYREHARELVPKMRKNGDVLKDDDDLYRGHHHMLDWYEREGHMLYTF